MGVSWLLLLHHTHCSYICAGHVAVLCCVLSRFRPVPAWAEGGRCPWCSAFKQRETNNKKQEGTHAPDNHVYIHMYIHIDTHCIGKRGFEMHWASQEARGR